MINYLLSQIQNMEQSVLNGQRKASDLQDREREDFMKRQQDLRMQNEDAKTTLGEVQAQVAALRGDVERGEAVKNELREKLRTAEEHNLEMANFIKSLQSQSESELAQMRNFMQSKISEDHQAKIKTDEKSSILFNELVRIGQESEKQRAQLQSLNY